MNFSTTGLRSILEKHGGFSRGHKFKVTFSNPPITSTNLRNLQLLCETASFPTRSAATSEHQIYGPVYQIPYRFTYTEISMNFMLTEDFFVKDFFDKWQEKIVDSTTGDLGYYEDYVSDIVISKYSANDIEMETSGDYQITILEAFPSIIGEVQFGHSLGNEVQRLPVTFLFKKWQTGASNNN